MAEEYDNKNNGAVFQPFPNNDFILEGKLDIDGRALYNKTVVFKNKINLYYGEYEYE